MNIIINSEEFVSHLNNIVGVVDRKQTMPILGHILMSGMSGEITITATDLEVQISSSFKANIPKTSRSLFLVENYLIFYVH